MKRTLLLLLLLTLPVLVLTVEHMICLLTVFHAKTVTDSTGTAAMNTNLTAAIPKMQMVTSGC